MIVNTAYIYMGSGGGGGGGDTPVNPNLWQDGVSNYPVEFTSQCSISSDGLNLTETGAATFSELQLTGFNSLTINLSPKAGMIFDVSIVIEFLNSAGQMLGTETVKFKRGEGAKFKTVNITSSAKIQNAKIRIKNNTRTIPVTLSSAVLS